MMQFCGHDPICRKFNNPEALQKAKANVEKHYPVVGITENINMTLGELVFQKCLHEFKAF